MELLQANEIWEEALKIIEKEITPLSFNTWIKPLKPLSAQNDCFTLETDDIFFKDLINDRYLNLIENVIKQITNMPYSVKITIPNENSNKSPLNNTIDDSIDPLDIESNINSKYTFETFVVGKSNNFAHAAALAVAEAPGSAYNPLFLYGGVGLGKTHLMHSIAHYILSQKPFAKIVYVSAEKFVNELVNSIRNEKNIEFRNKYRNIDVLLIDDIQFIAEKVGTQEEFFHTFNTLHESGKQIIISSDRPPKEIKPLEDRLRSRFEWGLIADIQPPDYETRLAILWKKAETENMDVPDDVMEFIAKSIDSNIRELEGALTRVSAYAKLTNQKVSLEFATNTLKDFLSKDGKKVINVELIQQIVASYYNIKTEEIKSKKRTQEITYPRQIAMYLCRNLTDLSLPKIGEAFGGRDHTTILHGYEKIAKDLKKDDALNKIIHDLESRITGK